MRTHDEVETILTDCETAAMLRARIRATLALRDYTATALIAETERLYMALEWIARHTCEPAICEHAREALDPPARLTP